MFANAAAAETVRLDFQGVVTDVSPLLTVEVGTTYTATALFDTDAPGAPYSFEDRYQFPDGLVAFDAVIGGEAISLTEPSEVQQGDDNLLAGFLYTDEFDSTDPGATRVSGTIDGLPVVGGRFFLIPAAFEDRNGFFSDRSSLLSGFDGTEIELPGLELGQFDIQLYDAELGYFPGFTATIAQGRLSLFEDDGGEGDGETPTGPGDGGNGGGGSPDPAPNPVPLPAGGLMLLAALGALRLRR